METYYFISFSHMYIHIKEFDQRFLHGIMLIPSSTGCHQKSPQPDVEVWDASPEVISKRYPGALHQAIQADAVVLSYPTGFDDKAPLLHIPYTLVTGHETGMAMEASYSYSYSYYLVK